MIVDRLTTVEAVDLVRHCLENGSIIPSKHFRDELAKESADINDAFHVLRCGNIFDPPEQDMKTGEWKYRIEGHIPDGQWLAIVFKFRTEDSAFVITIFSIERMRR
jgi:hypothetical protein